MRLGRHGVVPDPEGAARARADRDIGFGAGGLAARQVEGSEHVVGRAGHAAVLCEALHVRYSERQDNADNQHRDQQLVQREAGLDSVKHVPQYKVSAAQRVRAIRQAARFWRQTVWLTRCDLT